MAQASPLYPEATGKVEAPIINKLVEKYNRANICWPIIINKNNETIAYLYEVNKENHINLYNEIKPTSRSGLINWNLNYYYPRFCNPKNQTLVDFLDQQYDCSYDYIINSTEYHTIDLDYVWFNGNNFKGFELTTFYKEFTTKEEALRLISKMNRRPSWQGRNGARAFRKIAESSLDLEIDYYLICANTISSVGSKLKTDGNVCILHMTNDIIDGLENGLNIDDVEFMTFNNFLDWL